MANSGKKGLPASMDAEMVVNRVNRTMELLEVSQREYANLIGMDHSHLSRILSFKKKPSKKLLDALDMKAVEYYEYK